MECSSALEQQDTAKSLTKENESEKRTKDKTNIANQTRKRKLQTNNKNKTRRGYGRKNKKQNINKDIHTHLSILGTNANGLIGKQESLKNNINHFKPSIITVQETKVKRLGSIRLKGYQIFETLREGGLGGGLLTAVDENLEPVLIASEKDDETEVITVQIKAGKYNVRIINAYGPQEDDPNGKVFGFWGEVESHIIAAKENNCLVIVQMDANAKIGKDKITEDPNEESKNGRIMMEMVERQELAITNTFDNCKGTITRERVAEDVTERAVLDYILVCEKMKTFLNEMLIDEDRVHVLTKYAKKGNNKVSDHNIMFAKFNIKYNCIAIKTRKEYFNLKNAENQEKFHAETTNSIKFSTCFSNTRSTAHNANLFFKYLKGSIHKTFKKIRVSSGDKSKQGEETLQEMLKIKKELKTVIANTESEVAKAEAEEKLNDIETILTEKFSEKFAKIIKEETKHIETLEGNFSQIGFWKLKKKLCPQILDPPMAKINEQGMLVTSPNLLKDLYLRTYKHRLRQRIMKKEYLEIFILKNELWDSRMEELKTTKSEPWTMKNLTNVLKSLKNNKTMDPNGMINEIFKPGVIGYDLKVGLLNLFNKVKEELFIPEFMNLQNITSIYKSKGSRLDMNNERGIFILTVLKKILDKLIYFDNFDDVDKHMSDSNIGARRGRNIKNHLFMIYGIINSVIRGKEECVDIQIYDIEKAFDGLWLQDCMNDMFDSISEENKNDKLALLFKSNQDNLVSINTTVGLTDRIKIPNIVQQGGTWGPGLCSNSIDMVGRKSGKQSLHNYMYKKKSKVLIFAMCDDLNGVARCGIDSVALNSYINTHIELKKLRFHVPDRKGKSKCHKLHIGRNHESCPVLKVHGTVMESVQYDTYLGDIISADGKNTRNIRSRISKGVGKITQIMNLLGAISLGKYYIEIAILLRESIFLNGILTNAEVWYCITKQEMKLFEDLDLTLLRKILNVPYTTPSESFYLELGILPISIVIKARRVNYLHYILKREENEMLYTFFMTQWHNETNGDWTQQIKIDLEDLEIPCDFEFIKSKSRSSFKSLVKAKSKEYALKILTKKQEKHSKMGDLYYQELKLQNYFKIEGIHAEQALKLFKWRVKMAPFGENFRGNEDFKVCPLCHSHLDSQKLSFQCKTMNNAMEINCQLNSIYCNDIKITTAETITKMEKVREKLLKDKKNQNTDMEKMLPRGPCAQGATLLSLSAAKTNLLS